MAERTSLSRTELDLDQTGAFISVRRSGCRRPKRRFGSRRPATTPRPWRAWRQARVASRHASGPRPGAPLFVPVWSHRQAMRESHMDHAREAPILAARLAPCANANPPALHRRDGRCDARVVNAAQILKLGSSFRIHCVERLDKQKRFELQGKGNFGVTDGTRTHDDWNHNPGLYQLSYGHRRDQQRDLLAEQKQDYSDVFIALPSTFFTSSKYFSAQVRVRRAARPSRAGNARRASCTHAAVSDVASVRPSTSRADNAPARNCARASSNAPTPAFNRFGSDNTRRQPRAPGTPRYRPSA